VRCDARSKICRVYFDDSRDQAVVQNLCAPTGESTLSFSFSFSFSFSLSLSLSLSPSLSRSHALSSMSLTPKRREITNRDDAEINEQRLIALRFECVCIHKQTSWKPSHRVFKRSFKSEEFFFFFLSGRVLMRKLFFLFGVLRKNPSRFPSSSTQHPLRAKKIFAPRFGVLDGVELRNKRWKLATVS